MGHQRPAGTSRGRHRMWLPHSAAASAYVSCEAAGGTPRGASSITATHPVRGLAPGLHNRQLTDRGSRSERSAPAEAPAGAPLRSTSVRSTSEAGAALSIRFRPESSLLSCVSLPGPMGGLAGQRGAGCVEAWQHVAQSWLPCCRGRPVVCVAATHVSSDPEEMLSARR